MWPQMTFQTGNVATARRGYQAYIAYLIMILSELGRSDAY